MFCPKCGTQNDDSYANCTKCGTMLQAASSPPTEPVQHVPNYLVQAILVTAFCCMPFGIVSIVYAAHVNGKLQAGDYAGALAASRSAKTWCWVSVGCWVSLVLLGVLGALIGVID